MASQHPNDLGLVGIEFIEFSNSNPAALEQLFLNMGFSRTHEAPDAKVSLFLQNKIALILNSDPDSYGVAFSKLHGPAASAMGWLFQDAAKAYEMAIARGAKPAPKSDLKLADGTKVPAILGIGDSLIYFLNASARGSLAKTFGWKLHSQPILVKDKGFQEIDHLTNNVFRGTMGEWADFYKNIFGFYEIRYFDIKGSRTGLQSFALRSPDGSFAIPINEAHEKKSQINEYLDEYKGPGVQHIAFSTEDLLSSLDGLDRTQVPTLDMDADYYQAVFQRVPNVKEDHAHIERLQVLVDGDEEGYLLQIFTKNVIGPIFFEFIQRKNHTSFGEGNFTALFKSIERDQERRGVFKT